jgi:hypothetical protein
MISATEHISKPTPKVQTAPKRISGYTDEEIDRFAERIAAIIAKGGLDAFCTRIESLLKTADSTR